MRVVIADASSLGLATARKMIEAGHEVVLVDRDRAHLKEIGETLDCGLIEGDATHPSTLREAANDEACMLFALSESDQRNVLCALVGRSIGFERVVPQIVDPELLSVCDELGLEDVIAPNETVAASLRDMIDDQQEADSAVRLSGELRLTQVRIREKRAGMAPKDLEIGERSRPVALRRGDSEQLMQDDTVLEEDDEVIILGHRDDMKAILEKFQQVPSDDN